jgi:SEC-C motif-containing protein
MTRKIDCGCGSKLAYRDCCERFHEGLEPPDPQALVKARFCAFALGKADFLWKTLHPSHPLRSREEGSVLRELRQARETLRYREVIVHDSRIDGAHGRVVFTARVFRSGRDMSFVELSEFEHIEGGWRYLAGDTRMASDMPSPSFESFRTV